MTRQAAGPEIITKVAGDLAVWAVGALRNAIDDYLAAGATEQQAAALAITAVTAFLNERAARVETELGADQGRALGQLYRQAADRITTLLLLGPEAA